MAGKYFTHCVAFIINRYPIPAAAQSPPPRYPVRVPETAPKRAQTAATETPCHWPGLLSGADA